MGLVWSGRSQSPWVRVVEFDTDQTLSETRGSIYNISYDLSYDCRKFIVRSTYDSDLKRAEIYLRNVVS